MSVSFNNLSTYTYELIEDIERRIDADTEDDFTNQWQSFWDGSASDEPFTPKRKKTSAPGIKLKNININDAITDYDLMLASQLESVSAALSSQGDALCMRANYGTGILSSMFGAEIFMMPYEMNTLPTTRTIADGEKIKMLRESGVPDINNGFGRRVYDMGELMMEAVSHREKLAKYLTVYHPDFQGPLDICELMWGGEMFYQMYDEPDDVHALLRTVTDTYIAAMDKWNGIVPVKSGLKAHWNYIMHMGNIMLRDDSAMNISPEFYKEYAAAYDGELLKRYGGGVIHFCGRGDHYIDIASDIEGLFGINMSQPQYNDMEKIYRYTVDRGIKLLAFDRKRAERDKKRGFHGNMSC